jgi:NADP-dependent 3-hydroxy acid dehydrogenase YdfG
MIIKDSIVVITGGGSGIGEAMAHRFAADGATVIVSDRDGDAAARVAGEIAGTAVVTDVTDPMAIQSLVDQTLDAHGRVDLFCSNAGITTGAGVEDLAAWQRAWDVHVMAHVNAARAVLPSMLERGQGYLCNTASAAGLLTAPGDAPYTVTKHGAVAFAEWLSVTYGGRGIGVSVLCPLGVATPLLMEPLAEGNAAAQAVAASGEIISAARVADIVAEAVTQETFLILPHPEVGTFWAQKASDPARWLAGVRRLVDRQDQQTV